MFAFKKQKQGNRKVQPAQNLSSRAANANTKPFIVAAIVSVMLVSVLFLYDRYSKQILFPIKQVTVSGALKHVTTAELNHLVLADLQQGFFNIDLNAVAQKVESLNWVAQATLRRVWPNKVEVLLREHQAVAIWDKNTLISTNGVLFKVKSLDDYQHLAQIHGQQYQAKEVLLAYSELEQLVAPYGLRIAMLNSDESGAMRVRFNTQLKTIFAMQDKAIQFERFASLLKTGYMKVSETHNTLNNKALKSIDLRYSNGFSVVWQEPQSRLANKRHNTQAVIRVNGNQNV